MQSDSTLNYASPPHMPYMIMQLAPADDGSQKYGLKRLITPPPGKDRRQNVPRQPWLIHLRNVTQSGVELAIEFRIPIVLGVSVKQRGPAHVDLEVWGGHSLGVSRQHLLLSPSGDDVFAIDMKSTNGSKCNGKRIPTGDGIPLKDGDNLTLAQLDLQVVTVHKAFSPAEKSPEVTRQLKETGWL